MGGGGAASSAGGSAHFRGRTSGQHGDGVLELCASDSEIGQFRPSRVELCFGLRDVSSARDAAGEAVLCQRQVLFERLHGPLEQIDIAVQAMQLKVIDGEFGLQRQAGVLELGGTGLRRLDIRLHRAPDASPHVRLVGEVDRRKLQAIPTPEDAAAILESPEVEDRELDAEAPTATVGNSAARAMRMVSRAARNRASAARTF